MDVQVLSPRNNWLVKQWKNLIDKLQENEISKMPLLYMI